MATVAFPHNSSIARLPSGVNYSYIHIPAKPQKPTVLFLHGFPSSSHDWRHQISHFSSLGFGVMAPDLLGYGDTDKPSSPADYRGKKMAAEIIDLLNHAGLRTVHGVAHDWGVFLLSRLANRYPERLSSCSFLATAYRPPGQSLNVRSINDMTKQKLGYEMFGYWEFLVRDDAPQILKAHIESFLSILYPAEPGVWKEYLSPRGALEKFAKADTIVERGAYVSDREMAMHRRIMKDDYDAALNWYRCAMQDLNTQDEVHDQLDPTLQCPTLMIVAKDDALFNETTVKVMQKLVTNLRLVELSAGHWVQLERRDEVNAALEDFLFSNVSDH